MATAQCYTVGQPPIQTLLTAIKDEDIAIPEIQRPFVWDAQKVCDFVDSLYRGYPVGYLITWRNPTVKLKDGSSSEGKRILIDGQQRVTAVMAALLGREVVDKNYRSTRIRIAFHPLQESFAVQNAVIAGTAAWIPDISVLFDPKTNLLDFVNQYCSRNPGTDSNQVFRSILLVDGIVNNQIGLIELLSDLDIETVNKIFTRVNSTGVQLSQADFAMSKIAVNEKYNGHVLRKAIDYFCHLAVAPEFHAAIVENESVFAGTDFFSTMSWLKKENDNLYDPSYTDMLRVSFASQFRRGRLEDLVALLSGRNFETKQFEEAIVEDSFSRLKTGVLRFMNETNFKDLVMIIRSTGFVDPSMIGSQNALNFAYILYLALRDMNLPRSEIQRHVARWFVMSILTERYSTSPESTFDRDLKQIDEEGIEAHSDIVFRGELSDAFWETTLPHDLDTSSVSSPQFRAFEAAQVKLIDKGFLSRDTPARDLIEVKSDLHHIFPRDYLKKRGMSRAQYNQVANFAVTPTEINIAIGSKEPKVYFTELQAQCNGGKRRYGNITDLAELRRNFDMNCMPDGMEKMTVDDYPAFLAERRKLMARKIRAYFESL
jgi:hypothetical protein